MHPAFDPRAKDQLVFNAVALCGHDPRDFDIADLDTEAGDLPDPADQVIRVRRLSTGHQRLYVRSGNPCWFVDVMCDVDTGLFGRPAAARSMV